MCAFSEFDASNMFKQVDTGATKEKLWKDGEHL